MAQVVQKGPDQESLVKRESLVRQEKADLIASRYYSGITALTRKERLCCVLVFATISILILHGFHLFFLWRYSRYAGIDAPQSMLFYYILGILLIVIGYGIYSALKESVASWVIFAVSLTILLLPIIAIGAEAYAFYEFHQLATTL